MEIEFSEGIFNESDRITKGVIVLSDHKLYLKGPEGDITQTYIPLEKIETLKLTGSSLSLFVRPGVSYYFTIVIKGNRLKISELTKELVLRRGFKKKFLRKEWIEVKE